MPTSQNGWPANDWNLTQSYRIPGTTIALRFVKGPAGELLALFAAWFDKYVESIDSTALRDDWGYAERPIRGSTTTLSNHASGTAEDLNATQHPLGVRNTFTDPEEVKIRAMLRKLGGVIRGGLDYANRADEMHFEINVPPTADGLRRINAAVAILKSALYGAPAPSGPTPLPPKDTLNDLVKDGDPIISANSIRYAANGGYLRSGQAEARDDVETFLAWWIRLNRHDPALLERTQRDVRIWGAMADAADWQSAGLQLTGIIKNFQRRFNLVADGVFGPKSAAVMAGDGFVLI